MELYMDPKASPRDRAADLLGPHDPAGEDGTADPAAVRLRLL